MDDKPHYFDHRKRLRERFHKTGSEGLHDYELLELLLTYAIPRKDVKPLAKDLIKQFGSLAKVMDASQEELETVSGLGHRSATLIHLVKEMCGSYLAERMKGKDILSSPEAVVEFARMKMAGLAHEAFMVVYLNVKNEVIEYEFVHEGTVDRAIIYPRRVIESALRHHAASLVLVHNHPSGDPAPSPEDKRLTRSIAEAARTVDIRVIDHIIIGRGRHFGFHENNIMPDFK